MIVLMKYINIFYKYVIIFRPAVLQIVCRIAGFCLDIIEKQMI